jgi:hypothetical protein
VNENLYGRKIYDLGRQPLTEISTRNLPRCKERPAGNFTDICEPIVYKMW